MDDSYAIMLINAIKALEKRLAAIEKQLAAIEHNTR